MDATNIVENAAVDRARRHHTAALYLLLPFLTGCIGKYQSTRHVDLTADPPAAVLVLENYLGDCIIRGDPSVRGIRAEVELIGRGPSQADANEAVGEMTARLEPRHGSRPPEIVAMIDHPNNWRQRQHEARWTFSAHPDTVIRAKNVVGALEVSRFRRGAFLETGAGSVRVRDLFGGLTIVTQDGSADIEAGGRLEIRVEAGDADVRVMPREPDDVAVRVRAGKIALRLPLDRRGVISAESTLSPVRIDLGDLQPAELAHTENRVECRLGDAVSPRVDLTSEVGEITISMGPEGHEPLAH